MTLTESDLSELLAALQAGEVTDTIRASLAWILEQPIEADHRPRLFAVVSRPTYTALAPARSTTWPRRSVLRRGSPRAKSPGSAASWTSPFDQRVRKRRLRRFGGVGDREAFEDDAGCARQLLGWTALDGRGAERVTRWAVSP